MSTPSPVPHPCPMPAIGDQPPLLTLVRVQNTLIARPTDGQIHLGRVAVDVDKGIVSISFPIERVAFTTVELEGERVVLRDQHAAERQRAHAELADVVADRARLADDLTVALAGPRATVGDGIEEAVVVPPPLTRRERFPS